MTCSSCQICGASTRCFHTPGRGSPCPLLCSLFPQPGIARGRALALSSAPLSSATSILKLEKHSENAYGQQDIPRQDSSGTTRTIHEMHDLSGIMRDASEVEWCTKLEWHVLLKFCVSKQNFKKTMTCALKRAMTHSVLSQPNNDSLCVQLYTLSVLRAA